MIDYPVYTLSLAPPCPRSQAQLKARPFVMRPSLAQGAAQKSAWRVEVAESREIEGAKLEVERRGLRSKHGAFESKRGGAPCTFGSPMP